jgi:hippurate hydrolase
MEAGTKRNIIADKAVLHLTVRSFTPGARQVLLDETDRITTHIAEAYRAPRAPEIIPIRERTTAVYNDPAYTERLRALYQAHLGPEAVTTTEARTYGEDVGAFAEAFGCPGVFMELGAASAAVAAMRQDERPSLHSDRWAPDAEAALRTGIAAMTLAIVDALPARR